VSGQPRGGVQVTSDAGTLPRLTASELERVRAAKPASTLAERALAEGAEARRVAPRCGALIIGGAHGSLSVARSLGRKGIPVWFLTDDHLIPQYSRYVSRTVGWAGPDHADAAAFVLELARHHRLDSWVIICGGDAEARFVAQNHAALAMTFRLTTPPWETVQWASDKRLTYRRAAELGIDCPWSAYPRDRHEVAELDCRFPLILKPTVRNSNNAFTMEKAWRVDNRTELLDRYDQAAALVGADAIVLQELIAGRGSAQFSYAAVWDRGAPVASLVATRARQYPIDFGYTSTFVQTLERAPIEDAACRFLTSIAYSGLVEVEFKYDARDGRTKLLDVNARTWTWNGIGQSAGVDFAHILWRLAMGEAVVPCRGRAGVAWINWSRDLVAAVQEMRAGTLSPADYVGSLRQPLTFAAIAGDDILPGVVDLPLLAWRMLTRRLRAVRGTQSASPHAW
jgi:D-aspartate ligase